MYSTPQLSSQIPIEQVVRAYIISRNEMLLHRIVDHYKPTIDKAISHLTRKYNIRESGILEKVDLPSAGLCGFIEALNRFNPDMGVPLEKFANRRIRGEILDELRNYGYLPRSVIQRANAFDRFKYAGEDAYAMAAQETGTTEEKVRKAVWMRDNGRFSIEDDLEEREDFAAQPEQEKRLLEEEQASYIRAALDAIPQREKGAVIGYFYKDMTGAEIGKSGNLGNRVSESMANQIRRRGVKRLKGKLDLLN